MTFLTIALLFFFSPLTHVVNISSMVDLPLSLSTQKSIIEIDTMDRVIFDIDQSITDGDYVDIPVIISSDDLIFTLDFSMLIDTANLEFISVIDHTGELQYAAFLNPNDLKLRFTSNSFSPYPTYPQNVVSIRFKVVSGVIFKSDLEYPLAYLNGEPCSAQCSGEQYLLGSKDIITDENFISPNPAADLLYVNTSENGTLDMYDLQGNMVIRDHSIQGGDTNIISTGDFPRGTYLVSIRFENHIRKTQKIVLQ